MAPKVQKQLEEFVEAIAGRWQHRPTRKFIFQMLFGMIVSGKSLLSEIGRALRERCDLIRTEKRLSRNLGSPRLCDEALAAMYLEHVSPRLQRDHVIAVDMSDIAKPYSRFQEGLARIWDGSKQKEHDRGWPILTIEAVPPGRQQINLSHRLFSRRDRGYVSDNVILREELCRVAPYVPKGCLWVADRGFDGRTMFRLFDDAGVEWAIRLKGDRHLEDEGGWAQAAVKHAGHVKLTHSTLVTRIKHRREYQAPFSYGMKRVRLPGEERMMTLVVGQFRGKGEKQQKPIMILTTRLPNTAREIFAVVEAYLRRWAVEEGIRLVKQAFKLEDVRVMSLRSVQRIAMLAGMAYGFLGLVSLEHGRAVRRFIGRVMKAFGKMPRFWFYRAREAVGIALRAIGVPRKWGGAGLHDTPYVL